MKIAFLHHSTGQVVWLGTTSKVSAKVFGKSAVESWIRRLQQEERHELRDRGDELPDDERGLPLGQLPV